MGPDQNMHVAGKQVFGQRRPLAFPGRSGQQLHPHAESVEHPQQRGMMLRREDLGRRHQAGLKTVVACQKHTHQRDERFAAAHVALQQPVHLVAGDGILPDFADYPLLRSGQRERQFFVVKTVKKATDRRKQKPVVTGFPTALLTEYIQLDAEQFFELQPVFGRPQRLLRSRKMDVVQRVAQRHQPVTAHHVPGQRLAQMSLDLRPQIAHQRIDRLRAQLPVVQLFGRTVHSLHFGMETVRLFEHGFHLGMHEVQRAVEKSGPSENNVFAPRFEPFFDPVDPFEPHQFGRTATVGNDGDKTLLRPGTYMLETGDACPELDISQRIVGDLADAPDAAAVDITERKVVEQVAERADTELLLQQQGAPLPHSGEKLDVVVENITHLPSRIWIKDTESAAEFRNFAKNLNATWRNFAIR